jgi:RNA polymerase-binding transcription factor DksA
MMETLSPLKMAYYTAYDTNGNPYTACQCDRCHQRISNIYHYKGKVYGGDCIQVITGKKPDYFVFGLKDDGTKVIDEEATEKRDAEVKAAQEARAKKAQEDADRRTAERHETYRCHHEGLCVDCKQPIEAKRLNFAKFKRILIERCKACSDKRKAAWLASHPA